ncbi:hypothetical protein JCM3766R1_003955 [Sporobolomyces carnicolor]
MPPCNTGLEHVRATLAEFIPRIEFPPAPKLQNDTVWRCHTSFRAAVHYPFEAPEHEEIADYERLEHVGDAILGAEVSLIIHETYPRLVVGLRSLVKAVLVANSTLALISEALGLPPRLLSAAAQAKQFRTNPYIQACLFESFLATLHDEQGPVVLRQFLRQVYEPILAVAVETYRPFHSHSDQVALDPSINYVGRLMEWKVQKGFGGCRTLDFASRRNDKIDQTTWTVECIISDSTVPELFEPKMTSAGHSSVKGAKNAAAANACKLLGII